MPLSSPHPAAPPKGATYYVAPRGNDGNPCSAAAPCASLKRATRHAAPGDTVLVQAGTYGPQTITAQGAPGRPVTVAAQGQVTLTRPLPLTAQSQATWLLRIDESAYLTVRGFTVLGAKTQPGYDPNAQPWGGEVEVENHETTGAGITLQGLTVRHANNTCIKLQDHEPDAAIISNTVSDCGSPTSSGNLDHGIYTSGSHTLVEGNTVSGATGYGIQAWPTGGGDVGGITVRNNTVHDNALYGIVTGGSPVTITGNLAYSNRQGGIEVLDYQHVPTDTRPDVITRNVLTNNGDVQNLGTAELMLGNRNKTGTLIANNTFYRGARFAIASIQGIGGQYTAPLRVENNIFSGDARAYGAPNTGLFNAPPPVGSVVDYNLYYNVKPYANTNKPPSYDGGHSQVQVDPRFVDATARPIPDLRLRRGSPALGAATALTLPNGKTLAGSLGAIGVCRTCPAAPPRVRPTRIPPVVPPIVAPTQHRLSSVLVGVLVAGAALIVLAIAVALGRRKRRRAARDRTREMARRF